MDPAISTEKPSTAPKADDAGATATADTPMLQESYVESAQGDSDDALDELDDILDEFDEPEDVVNTQNKLPKDALDEDWARQLQLGMADLLNDVNESPELQAQVDNLARELQDAMAAATTNQNEQAGSSEARTQQTEPINFQDRLKQAMDQMKNSEARIGAAIADADGDFLAEMMKQLGTTDGGEDDFSGMLVNMMEQLTSKEILYEPMKELSEKYPKWLQDNRAKETEADLERYQGQYAIIQEIVTKFEEVGYKDDDDECRQYIIGKMQKMQEAGAPPPELMGDMSQDIEAPDLGSDCGVQ